MEKEEEEAWEPLKGCWEKQTADQYLMVCDDVTLTQIITNCSLTKKLLTNLE